MFVNQVRLCQDELKSIYLITEATVTNMSSSPFFFLPVCCCRQYFSILLHISCLHSVSSCKKNTDM